ncbi:arylesterase [Fulvitalea axinellae]|uniref:Arylesterase n=1 Tax=Fulvitalea axinellae TaxID=1182444 RepID=A0AAU9CFY2_9BACT|nr:arylesterase [Fulvitalea axinellae]
MKKKKAYIALAVLGILGIAGYFLVSTLFSGPLYSVGELTESPRYAHLLKACDKTDKANHFVLNDDISIYYQKYGEGKPALVIHGGPGIPPSGEWPGLDRLTSSYAMHYYHQRGCGQSTRPFDTFESGNFFENMKLLDENLGIPAQLADIEQIRKKLGTEKITLIGHSFGGFLASLYASEFPDNVEALVLIAPASVLRMPVEGEDLFGTVRSKLPENEKKNFDLYLERFFDFGSLFEKSESELAKLHSEFIPYYQMATGMPVGGHVEGIGGWHQFACYISMGKKHDYSKSLANIKAPTLILHGDKDLSKPESVKLYRENIPGNRFELIRGAGHFIFADRPNELYQTVSEFLSSAGN